jgi:hypothetical protein
MIKRIFKWYKNNLCFALHEQVTFLDWSELGVRRKVYFNCKSCNVKGSFFVMPAYVIAKNREKI